MATSSSSLTRCKLEYDNADDENADDDNDDDDDDDDLLGRWKHPLSARPGKQSIDINKGSMNVNEDFVNINLNKILARHCVRVTQWRQVPCLTPTSAEPVDAPATLTQTAHSFALTTSTRSFSSFSS